MHRLRTLGSVAELIRGLHPEIKRKVRSALQIILDNPHTGKALKDELAGLRSFRIGRYRVIYGVGDDETIEMVSLGPRRRIYEETYRLLRRDR